MDYYAARKNPLLLKNNFLRKKEKSNSITITSPIYGKEVKFPIVKDIDELSQTFMEIDVYTDLFETSFDANFLAFKIFSDTFLETSQKLNLVHLKSVYQIYKYEQLKAGLYAQASVGINMPVAFHTIIGPATTTSGYCRLKIPLSFFFSMNYNYLDIRNMENIQIRSVVNNQTDIGMVDDLAALLGINELRIKFIRESFNNKTSHLDQFLNNSDFIPRQIKGSFNIFYEEKILLLSGTRSATFLLRCPYPCVNVIASISSQNTRAPILSYSLKIRNEYIVGGSSEQDSIDCDTSYNLSNDETVYHNNEYFEHFFNKENTELSNTGLMTFSAEDNTFPTYLTLYYEQLGVDSYLEIFEEYITNHAVDSKGKISANNTDSYLKMPFSVLSE